MNRRDDRTAPGLRRARRGGGAAALAVLVLVAATTTASAEDVFTTVPYGPTVGPHISLALDAAGNPVVAFYDDDTDDLKILHCNDPVCAGGDDSITTPDSAGSVGSYPSLVLDAAGNPVVSYRQTTSPAGLKILHCNDPNCAGNDESITSPDTTVFVGSTSLQLDASGRPIVAYADGTNNDLRILRCNDVNCAAGGDTISSPDTGLLIDPAPSLQLNASGFPTVAYFDFTNQDLKILVCDDPACTGGGETTNIAWNTNSVGWSPSLAIDAAGNLVVSFADVTNPGIIVLRCEDAFCAPTATKSLWRISSLGSQNNQESLELDADGHPVIAFHTPEVELVEGEETTLLHGDLYVVDCGDPSCTTSGPRTTAMPDTAGEVGVEASLALDSEGLPVIAYLDATNGDLKILRCDDPGCLPPTTWHVDPTATGNDSGTSWANAFPHLQDALAVARTSDTIVVAEGTYTPHASDRTVAFRPASGVTVIGGYPAGGGPTADPAQYPTILSGDLAGNDNATVHPSEPTRTDNAYNVVVADTSTGAATLVGLTIADGNANGSGVQGVGGGVAINNADLELRDVTVTRNSAIDGGGIRIGATTGSVLRDVTVSDNLATGNGGGLLVTAGAEAVVVTSTLAGNTANGTGGGAVVDAASAIIHNTEILGNTAGGNGGGVSVRGGGDLEARNLLVAGNEATSGGGIANNGSELSVIRSTIADNVATNSGGGAFQGGTLPIFILSSSIVWGNSAPTNASLGGTIPSSIGWTVVEGGAIGNNVTTTDPLFVDAPGGNYRLTNGSPAIDTGIAPLFADVYDVDLDANLTEQIPDLDLEDRIQGVMIDRGAYEGGETPVVLCNGLTVTVNLALGQSPTNGDDVILGTSGPDVIDALDGNDTVCGGDGADDITGGLGDDTLFGGEGGDTLRGLTGVDTLYGDAGSDILVGHAGADIMHGGDDGDFLYGGPDGDTMFGDAGDDNVLGQDGNDTIDGGDDDDYLRGGDGDDTIDGGLGADRIYGENDDDILTGDDGNDGLYGGSGNDTLDGGDIGDTLSGNAGDDTIIGGGGNDTAYGGSGLDTITGDGGVDVVDGQQDADTVDGGPANADTVRGGTGADTLIGGGGIDDSCDGGVDTDTDTADSTCETTVRIP